MTTKKTKLAILRTTWDALHGVYVAIDSAPVDGEGRVKLRELAARFNVPFAAADDRACREKWELERLWRRARRWYADFGEGATTEADFVERFKKAEAPRSTAKGIEGARFREATAIDLWRRVMGPALEWEAHREVVLAREALEAVETTHRRTSPRLVERIIKLEAPRVAA